MFDQIRQVAVAALAGFVFSFLAVALWIVHKSPPGQVTPIIYERCDNCKIEVKEDKTFLAALESDPVAAFTALLFVATVVLAGVTVGLYREAKNASKEQATLTRESLAKAERSAQAAERALEGVDAPFISVLIDINAVKHNYLGGGVAIQYKDFDRLIVYKLTNFGKSPAFVLEVYRGLLVSRAIPQSLPFPPLQSNLSKLGSIGPDRETLEYSFSRDEVTAAGGDENDRWENFPADNTLWIIFQIRYRDAVGSQFVSGHTFAFNAARKDFYAQGGTKYNYRRKLTEDELAAMVERDA